MKITVKVIKDSQEVLSRALGTGAFRIGRSDFSDIVLSDDAISRSHVEIRVTDSSVYVTNMTSSGRMKLNGEMVETGEVKDGDELMIGPYRVIIYFGDLAAEAAAQPDAQVNNDAANLGGEIPADEANKLPDFVDPVAEPPASPPPMEDLFPVEGTAALVRSETVVEAKPVVAKLMFSSGPRQGDELMLEAYEVTFGRSKKADIFLDDEKLSRLHAKITRVGMGFRLIDLNSRNGTFVNGMRVLEHPLASFDEIEIGSTKIKFLIHDMILGELGRGGNKNVVSLDQTKSVEVDPNQDAAYIDVDRKGAAPPSQLPPGIFGLPGKGAEKPNRRKLLWGGVAALLLVLYLLPDSKTKPEITSDGPKAAITEGKKKDAKTPPSLPREYGELSQDVQRQIEGNYNSAIRWAEREQYERAVAHLKKVHEFLPYYKQSKELLEQYNKRVKEREAAEAMERARRDEKQDLAIYLEDGIDHLRRSDWAKASESFHLAINIDPNNAVAAKGLKAVEYKVTSLDKVPADRNPEEEKRKLVSDLFEQAVTAFYNKSYQEAIDKAEKIRTIELKGDEQYLNKAKQIIDRARMMQKELFEPFLLQAKEKYTEGDYTTSRDLCEEMLKQDPAYEDAKECLAKAKNQLNRLAKEAYTHGYILESMNRIEEAKQYWNRAKNYVRPGDPYYDKVMKKLDYYQ